ncbi:MAG: sensor histidine kinase [Pseudonocardiaceae bacterium]
MTGPLRTGSLRRRVTWSSVAVLVTALLLVLVLADVAFGTQSQRELAGRVDEQARLAAQLARAGVPAPQLLGQVQTPDVAVQLVAPDGQVYGRPPPGPPHRGPMSRRALPDGSLLILTGDTELISAAQGRLRGVLMLVGVLAIALAAVVLLATTRVALAPLDAMTALARSIAGGDRGRRLSPTRTDTELGRTAAAFDSMLDALEGTEAQARASETRALASEARTRQFVADAAHELRTPLAGVRAAAEAGVAPGLTEPERQRLHVLLVREAGRASRLVADLLALARLDAGQQPRRAPVELLDLARTEVERIRLLAPDLDVRVDGQPVTVDADAQQVFQVLANLLDNARRYATGQIAVLVAGTVDGAVVTMTDDGPGIAESDRERIFDRLVRLDEARTQPQGATPSQDASSSHGPSGAGLGLAIARGFARAHGGDLRCVAPTPGMPGGAFRLELPCS